MAALFNSTNLLVNNTDNIHNITNYNNNSFANTSDLYNLHNMTNSNKSFTNTSDLHNLYNKTNNITNNNSFTNISDLYNLTTTNSSDNNATELQSARLVLINLEYRIVYSIIGITGFLLNVFVAVVLIFVRSKNSSGNQSSSEFHITCQACVDSLVAIFLLTTTLIEDNEKNRYIPGNLYHESLCKMWYTKIVLWGAINASIYSVVILNFERYIAVVYPIFHKTKFTKSKKYSVIMLLTVWVFGIGFKFFYSIISSGIVKNGQCSSFTEYPSKTMQNVVGFFIFIFDFCLPLTLLTCMYLRMALFLHNKIQPGSETLPTGQKMKLAAENSTVYSVQTSKIEMEASNVGVVNEDADSADYGENEKDLTAHVNNNNAPNHLHQPNNIPGANVQKMKPKSTMARARDNILKTSMILSLSFAMCISLNEVYFFLAAIFPLSLDSWVYQLSVILVFMNSCFNPIIYCLKYDPFKKKVQYAYKNFKKLIKK